MMKVATRAGMTSTTIQAPCANFVTAITTVTIAVAVAPTPLIAIRHRQPLERSRSQCRTMPDCESVNEMKTPTA